MASHTTALPRSILKDFKKSPNICIQYKSHPDAEPEVLRSFFPKAVATNFSSKWSKLWPSKVPRTTITIVGGDRASRILNLKWMLSCCQGNGVVEPVRILNKDKPFALYCLSKDSASSIGCDYLVKKFGERMEGIAARQIHSEDVRALWKILPADHEIRVFLPKHISQLIFNGDLQSASTYWTLREEFPDLHEAINADLEPQLKKRKKDEKAERTAKNEKEREERRQKQHKQGSQGNKAASIPIRDPDPTSSPPTPVKKIVPGANETAGIPFFKNKAARQREKRRQQKAAASADGLESHGDSTNASSTFENQTAKTSRTSV